MLNNQLQVPFDDQCQRVLNILAIQKVVMPITDLLWRVKPCTQEQLQFALDRIIEDGHAEPSTWSSGGSHRQTMYQINLKGLKFHAAGGYTEEARRRQQKPAIMSNEEKLNAVLKAYLELGVGKGEYAYEMGKRFNLGLPAEEVVMLARHLEEEKYLDWIQLTRTSRKNGVETREKLSSKEYFTANIKGRVFVEKGGYTKNAFSTSSSIQQSHHYNINGTAVIDHSSGRHGDNEVAVKPISTPAQHVNKSWFRSAMLAMVGWFHQWWFAIIGPALIGLLLQVPTINETVLSVLGFNQTDSHTVQPAPDSPILLPNESAESLNDTQ